MNRIGVVQSNFKFDKETLSVLFETIQLLKKADTKKIENI